MSASGIEFSVFLTKKMLKIDIKTGKNDPKMYKKEQKIGNKAYISINYKTGGKAGSILRKMAITGGGKTTGMNEKGKIWVKNGIFERKII